MRADVHMHTNFSHDSKSSPEEMIQGAIEKGLEVICFTDHFDKDNMSWGLEDIFDPEAYFQAMIPLREKYRGALMSGSAWNLACSRILRNSIISLYAATRLIS